IVVDTDAAPLPDDAKKDDTPGRKTNETSTDIPAVIFVSTAGAAAAAGAAGASGKIKKDNKKKSTFRLAINKQFGDTIRMQGKPEFVYARIIEVTPEGHEFTREDLSEKIRIYAGSAGINVEETGMIGGYKSARVFAPKSDEVECIVSFRFEYEGNSYTNNVRFWLEEPGILFYQENLALPAKYDKEAELPFTVTGFEPDKATVELRMSEGAPYHVQLVESENDPSTHWAVLTDICDKDQDAGTMLDCYLIVSVTDGEVTIEEQFPVTRVGLGLNFAMPALNCFRIPKKSAEGKRWDELTYSDFEAATTTARVVLILFDEEQQRIIQMPADPTFELTPIVNDDISKERIDGLGLKTRLTKVESGYSEVTFFCEKGWLEPPVRLFMNIKATWKYGEGDKKETYVCEKKVLMRSQPLREYKNENMRTAAYKTDKERFELLDRMTDMILHNNWFDELEELYARAFLMMKYYDYIYGYDDLQFEQIHGAFMSYLGYRQAKLEYAAAKDNYQADKKNDDLLHEIAFRAGAMNSSWTGIISRIALGIGTAGGSEIFLAPLDIINSGVEYQMENLPEEQTTWGKLWAGVKAPVISLGIGYAFKLGGWAGGKLVNAGKAAYRATAKAVPKIAKYTADKVSKSALLPKSLKNGIQKASKYFDELAESVPECDPKGLKGSASAAQEAMEQAVLRGEASADDIIKSLSGDLTQLEKLQVAAVEAGNKEGAELLNGLKAAIDNYRLSGKSPMTEG
ncbi:MAG: hypothetical protein IK093_00550, partial [Ruminiclostridium sp.]|nr:hypothetical protein [Ruminiclostridium sp.]